jgi:hypothetical protein
MTNRTDNVTANKGQVQRKSVLFLFTLDLPFVGHYIVCPVFIYSLDLPFVGHYIVCPILIYALDLPFGIFNVFLKHIFII